MNLNKKEQIIEMLNHVISEVNIELEHINKGLPSFTTDSELSFILATLMDMLKGIEKGKDIRSPGLWRIVIDMWPYKTQLRAHIIEVEYDYEKFMKKQFG